MCAEPSQTDEHYFRITLLFSCFVSAHYILVHDFGHFELKDGHHHDILRLSLPLYCGGSAVDTIIPQPVLACTSSSIVQTARCFPDIWIRRPVAARKLHYWHFIIPGGIPFRQVYYVFALDTFVPNFSKVSSIDPVPPPARLSPLRTAPQHTQTSSAKVLPFWCFSSVNRLWWHTGKCWKQILGAGQLPLQTVRLFLQLWWCMFFTDLMYFSGTTLSRMHQYSSSLGTLSFVLFQINEYTVLVLLSL